MNIVITHENLKNALNNVSKISIKRNELPVLSNVLFKIEDDLVTLVTTNLETAIIQKVSGKIIEKGTITIPMKLITSYINSLPDGNVTLSAEGNNVSISTKQFKSTINGISADEFPVIPSIDTEKTFSLASGVLKDTLQKIIIASSNDDSRPILNGVHIQFTENEIIFAATDGYRLSEVKVPLSTGLFGRITVPSQTINEVLRVINDGDINIHYDDNQIKFTCGDTEIISKLLDGEYPEYEKLIPDSSEISVIVKKKDLTNVAKIANLFSKESAGAITIEASEEDQVLKVNSVATQVGDNESNIEGTIKGSGMVTINSSYLIDALSTFDGDEVLYRFSGAINPTVLEVYLGDDKKEDRNHLHIIMPLKN